MLDLCACGIRKDSCSDIRPGFLSLLTRFSNHVGEPVAKTVSIRPSKPAPVENTTEVEDSSRTHTSEQHNGEHRIQNVNSTGSNTGIADPFAGTELALIFGDSWIIATTFLTSSLFPQTDIPYATAAVVSCWVLVSLVRGDYKSDDDDDAAWVPGWTVYTGILAARFTWLFSTPLVLLAYSVLVSHGLVDETPVMVIEEGAKVSPALEIQVALLIVMTAWRGLYYAFRDGVV